MTNDGDPPETAPDPLDVCVFSLNVEPFLYTVVRL